MVLGFAKLRSAVVHGFRAIADGHHMRISVICVRSRFTITRLMFPMRMIRVCAQSHLSCRHPSIMSVPWFEGMNFYFVMKEDGILSEATGINGMHICI